MPLYICCTKIMLSLLHAHTTTIAMAWRSPKQFGTCTWMYDIAQREDTTLITQISCDDAMPGDAVISSPHIMLFREWIDKSQKKWVGWEEKGTTSGTVQEVYQFVTIEDAMRENSNFRVSKRKTRRGYVVETPASNGVFLKLNNGQYKSRGLAKRAHICIRRSGISE